MTQAEDSNKKLPSHPAYGHGAHTNDTLDLVEVVAALWTRKISIFAIAIACAIAGVAYALLVTPIYRAEAVLAPTQSEAPGRLPPGLSGLAGLAGVNIDSSRDATQEIATLRSRVFVEEFIEQNELLPVLLADQWDSESERWLGDAEEWPDIRDGVNFFVDNVRSVREDRDTGLVTVSIEWTDPEIAAAWLEKIIRQINETLRARDLADSRRRLEYLNNQLEHAGLVELRQAISGLIEGQVETIMLAQAEAEYAFTVIDPPRVPIEAVWPRKKLIVVLSVFAGGMLGCLAALLHWAVTGRKREHT